MRKTAYVSALTAVAVLGGAATASAADPVTSKYLLNVTDGQVKAKATPSTTFATSAAPVAVFGNRTTDADTPDTAVLEGFKVPATTVATGFTQTLTKGDPAVTTTLKSDVSLAATTLSGTETLTGDDKGKVALSGAAKLVFKVSSTVGTAAAKTATCNVATTADLALASKPDVTTPGTSTGTTASGTYVGKARGTDNAVAINGAGASTVTPATAEDDADVCTDLGTALGLTGTGADDKLAVRLAGTLAPRPIADYTGAFTGNSLQFGTEAPAAVAATSIPFKTDGDTDALATLDATKAAFALPAGLFVVKLGTTPTDTFVSVAFPTAEDVTGNVNLKDGAKITGKGEGLFYDTALPAKVTPTYTFGAKQCAPAAPVDLDLVADRDETGDVVLGADAAAQKDQALSQTDGSVAYTAGAKVTALKPVGTTATQTECDDLVAKYATTFGSDDLKLRLAGTLKPTTTPPPSGGGNNGGGAPVIPIIVPQPKPPVTPTPKPVVKKVKAKPHATAKTPSRVRRGRTVTVKVKVRNASSVGVGTKLRLRVTVPKGLKISGSKSKTVGTLKARKTKTITLKFRTSRSTKSTNRVRFSVSGTNAVSAKGSVRVRVR